MAHNLFSERFLSLRVHAWHELGQVVQEELGAQDAWRRLMPYDFERRPVTITLNGEVQQIGEAIVRTPVPDDPIERNFGIVTDSYTIVTPQTICEVYDRVATRPVETIGALGKGETFFLTTKLPDYDVNGDPMESYLFIFSPYAPGRAIEVRNIHHRAVCQNTCTLALRRGTQIYKGWHNNKDIIGELEIWMEHAILKAEQNAGSIEQWFKILADYELQKNRAIEMLFNVYPDPLPLPGDYPIKLRDKAQKAIDEKAETAERNRNAVSDLFNGGGTGITTGQIAGTAWAWYNAVTEFEDYRASKKSPMESILVGGRAQSKAAAFEVAYVEATSKK
jgi:hypothetical protein